MLADLAKVERIVEADVAQEGFCIQLTKERVYKRLHQGVIEAKGYRERVGRWDYSFYINGEYNIEPEFYENDYVLVTHHIQPPITPSQSL